MLPKILKSLEKLEIFFPQYNLLTKISLCKNEEFKLRPDDIYKFSNLYVLKFYFENILTNCYVLDIYNCKNPQNVKSLNIYKNAEKI